MGKLIDLTKQRFGFWVVQNRDNNTKSGQVQWNCLCECGNNRLVTTNSLRSGNSTSCGCNHAPDLTDKVFDKLTVVKLSNPIHKGRRYWLCKCECGKEVIASTYSLRECQITSCKDCRADISEA